MTNTKVAWNAVWDLEDEVVGSGDFPNKVSTDELEGAIMRIANRHGIDSLVLTQRMKSAALNLFQPHPNTTRLVQQLTHLLTPSARIQYGEGISRPSRQSIVSEGHTLDRYITDPTYGDRWVVDSATWLAGKINELADAIADELHDAGQDPLEPGFRKAIMPTLVRALEARGVKL